MSIAESKSPELQGSLTYAEYVGMEDPELIASQELQEYMTYVELGHILNACAEPDIIRLGLLSDTEPRPAGLLYERFLTLSGLSNRNFFPSSFIDTINLLPAGLVSSFTDENGDVWLQRTPLGRVAAGIGGHLIDEVSAPHNEDNITLRSVLGVPKRELKTKTDKDGLPAAPGSLAPLFSLLQVHLAESDTTLVRVEKALNEMGIVISRNSVSKQLQRLAERKLLESTPPTNKKDFVKWSTTELGEKVLKKLLPILGHAVRRTPGFVEEGLDKLNTYLDDGIRKGSVPHLVQRAMKTAKIAKKHSKLDRVNSSLRRLAEDHPELQGKHFTSNELVALIGDESTKAIHLRRVMGKLGTKASIIEHGRKGRESYWELKPTTIIGHARRFLGST